LDNAPGLTECQVTPGERMTDVFISYKREERPLVEQIAYALVDLGFDVWFDASLTAGESFSDEINRVARLTNVNLVCWSPNAIASRWIKAEALIGFERETLAAAYISGPDGFSPPAPFNAVHTVDLRKWCAEPTPADPEWRSILRRVGQACGRPDVARWGALSVRSSSAEIRAWLDEFGESSPLHADVQALQAALVARDEVKASVQPAALERQVRDIGAKEPATQPPAQEMPSHRGQAIRPHRTPAPRAGEPPPTTGSRDASWLRALLEEERMPGAQWIAVLVCTLANAVTAMGMLSLSFALPAVRAEFGFSATQLSFLFTATVVSSVVSALAFGPFADLVGRRRVLLLGFAGAAVSLAATILASTFELFLIGRVFTGLTLGVTLGPLIATTGEWASRRARGLAVSLMVMGYSAGAVASSFVASPLIVTFGWRSMFVAAAIGAAAVTLLVYLLVPEPIPFLLSKGERGARERINHTLRRLGHAQLEELPEATPAELRARGPAQVFAQPYLFRTIVLAIGLLATSSIFALVQSFMPLIARDSGHTNAFISTAVTAMTVGSIVGALTMGFLSASRDVRRLGVYALALCATALGGFALLLGSANLVVLASFFIGITFNAAITSFYIRLASSDPAFVRATSASAVLGVGRIGSFIGPLTGGALLSQFGSAVAFFTAAAFMVVVAIGMGLVRPSERERAPI
jgi:MFS transporter, AAHS family, vanillate permease